MRHYPVLEKLSLSILKSINKNGFVMGNTKYEEAVELINTLQSNAAYIKNANSQVKAYNSFSTTIYQTQKYLFRTGITLEQLDKLSVIHISGTKGKGSTCAFCESILRQYGYKTGFYSSPHLVSIRERIRINGVPLSEEYFAENTIKVYNKLHAQQEHENDLPLYFRFMTVLAFNVFIAEKVDVAVIEVGIGGEYDCTNVIRKTPIVGITSLALEHTNMLGDTIEEIAWQKSGIMKSKAHAFTVDQPESAISVLKDRSVEKECSLKTVPNFDKYLWKYGKPVLGIGGNIQNQNASLAIQLAHAWMIKCGNKSFSSSNDLEVPELTKIGLEKCKWPGRHQILKTKYGTFYMDGAHTIESIEFCSKWFQNNTTAPIKVLLFNVIGYRDSEKLLQILKKIKFTHVYFVPNISSPTLITKDQIDVNQTADKQVVKCQHNKEVWINLQDADVIKNTSQIVSVFPSISDAISTFPKDQGCDILVTGSLHLVGAALTVFDQNYKIF